MSEYSQADIRKVVFMSSCEDPMNEPEFVKWINDNKGHLMCCHKIKEGFVALIHFEPVFAENVVLQGSSSQPVPDSQPSLDLPVV